MSKIQNKFNLWNWLSKIWNWIGEEKNNRVLTLIIILSVAWFGYQKYQAINLDLDELKAKQLKVERLEVERDAIIKGNATTTGEQVVGSDGPPSPGCFGMRANDNATWIYFSFTSNGNIVTSTNASMCGSSTSTLLIGR